MFNRKNTRPAQKPTTEACKLTLNELKVEVITKLIYQLESATQTYKKLPEVVPKRLDRPNTAQYLQIYSHRIALVL